MLCGQSPDSFAYLIRPRQCQRKKLRNMLFAEGIHIPVIITKCHFPSSAMEKKNCPTLTILALFWNHQFFWQFRRIGCPVCVFSSYIYKSTFLFKHNVKSLFFNQLPEAVSSYFSQNIDKNFPIPKPIYQPKDRYSEEKSEGKWQQSGFFQQSVSSKTVHGKEEK